MKPVPLFNFQILNTLLVSLWNVPPNPRYMRNLNLSVLQDAPLHIWKLPSAVRLRESLSGHRAVFLKALYTATDAEDVTAADKMLEMKIDVWILEMFHFPRNVTGLYIRRRKAAELMVKHRSRNLIPTVLHYNPLEHLHYPTMKTLVGKAPLRSYMPSRTFTLFNLYCLFSVLQCDLKAVLFIISCMSNFNSFYQSSIFISNFVENHQNFADVRISPSPPPLPQTSLCGRPLWTTPNA